MVTEEDMQKDKVKLMIRSTKTAAEQIGLFEHHRTRAERYAMGKSLRKACPRSSHAAWKPPAGRPDPVKVVGVGSVGTRCWVLLLMAGNHDPLFLQVKEARASVLEAYAGRSVYPNHGQRIVNGQRLIQPYSDMFLGWTVGKEGHHGYFRQLRDIKVSIAVETFNKTMMTLYAEWYGRALALAHARSGDAAMISGYMGKSDAFDQAIADFSTTYADQNEKDHAALKRAVKRGKIKAVSEEPE